MSDSDKWRVVAANVIARTWRDPAYKATVLKDPKAALSAAGLSLPDAMQVTALENTVQNKYVVLPSQEHLQADPVAGAKLLKAITPMPSGVRVTLLQDTADNRHFVLPIAPANNAVHPHSEAGAAIAMTTGWEAVSTAASIDLVAEVNAVVTGPVTVVASGPATVVMMGPVPDTVASIYVAGIMESVVLSAGVIA